MKNWPRITLLYLLLVAVFGMLLRYAFIHPTGFVFQFFKHTHSHIAFLGWVFNAIFILIIKLYFSKVTRQIKLQFYLFQFSIVGMLLTFPFQGYAPLSIAFSTIHIIISIWFYFSTLTDLPDDTGTKWVKLAGLYMVVSNLGPLSLAPILMLELKDSFIYHLSLQHYLHFQYNGWFLVAGIGLFLKAFNIKLQSENLLFWLLGWSVIPLFFVTVELIESNVIYRVIGGLASLAQLIGVLVLIREITPKRSTIHTDQKWVLWMVFIGFCIKSLFQFAVSFPKVSSTITTSHNPTIGFLHLIFLGVITNLFLLLLLRPYRERYPKSTNTGLTIFNLGVVMMVGLLFIQPYVVPPNYFHWLFYSTIPIFAGIAMITLRFWLSKPSAN